LFHRIRLHFVAIMSGQRGPNFASTKLSSLFYFSIFLAICIHIARAPYCTTCNHRVTKRVVISITTLAMLQHDCTCHKLKTRVAFSKEKPRVMLPSLGASCAIKLFMVLLMTMSSGSRTVVGILISGYYFIYSFPRVVFAESIIKLGFVNISDSLALHHVQRIEKNFKDKSCLRKYTIIKSFYSLLEH